MCINKSWAPVWNICILMLKWCVTTLVHSMPLTGFARSKQFTQAIRWRHTPRWTSGKVCILPQLNVSPFFNTLFLSNKNKNLTAIKTSFHRSFAYKTWVPKIDLSLGIICGKLECILIRSHLASHVLKIKWPKYVHCSRSQIS